MSALPDLRLREFPDRGPLVWFALTAGIVAWMVHLTVFAAIVELVHDHGWFWLFYLGNGVALALAVLAMWLSWLIARAGADAPEDAGTVDGRIRFVGLLGLLVNGINILLIALEGTYVFFISISPHG